ncbi:MAG: hypothetical protein ACR2P2_11705 [Nakamurella sp.]
MNIPCTQPGTTADTTTVELSDQALIEWATGHGLHIPNSGALARTYLRELHRTWHALPTPFPSDPGFRI